MLRQIATGIGCDLFPLARIQVPIVARQSIRTKYYHNRHRDPKYRTERARKVWPVNLPDFDYMRKTEGKQSPEEIRSKLKEKGVVPPSPYEEREMYSPSTMALIDEYKPPGDGKSSSIVGKVKVPLVSSVEWNKRRQSVNMIRQYEGNDFDLDVFARQSVEIYTKAHEALSNKDEEGIFDYVTEHCFPLMTAGINRHTIIWKFLGEVEPPEVVQVRVADLVAKTNKYAQITVKMHTKQIMAVFDRHGRLMLGSPTDSKDVLEYIVFEKYLANEYGSWRIHARIRPEESNERPIQVKTRVNLATQ